MKTTKETVYWQSFDEHGNLLSEYVTHKRTVHHKNDGTMYINYLNDRKTVTVDNRGRLIVCYGTRMKSQPTNEVLSTLFDN